LAVPPDHGLAAAFATLDSLAASPNALPAKAPQPFGPSWQGLIDQPDRAAALGCFRAATLMALKRALRNRSVSVDHSLSYRAPEDKLIPRRNSLRGARPALDVLVNHPLFRLPPAWYKIRRRLGAIN
jgi:hypothetical protein